VSETASFVATEYYGEGRLTARQYTLVHHTAHVSLKRDQQELSDEKETYALIASASLSNQLGVGVPTKRAERWLSSSSPSSRLLPTSE
jgi:hypothetical protein